MKKKQSNQGLSWRIVSWLFIICGISAYLIGWTALATGSQILVPTQFWFYDAVAAGIFGLFFMIYSVHSRRG